MPNPPPDPRGGLWRLVPYLKENGRCPVQEWLDEVVHRQQPADYVDFYDVWKPRFEKNGPIEIGTPHWEGVRKGLGEIRWGDQCRIYCSLESDQRIVMYLGRIKRWRIFVNADRRLCEQRRAEFLSESYDQESRTLRYRALCQKRGKNGSA